MAESKRVVTIQFEDSVNPGQSKVMDSVPLSDFQGVNYAISYLDSVANLSRSLKMDVAKTEGTIIDQVYAKSGSSGGVLIDAVLNGSQMDLIVTNNRTNPVDLVITQTIA